jgi:hypothetical protein
VLGSAGGRTDAGTGPTTSFTGRGSLEGMSSGGGGGAQDGSISGGDTVASMSLASDSNASQAVDTLRTASSEADSCRTITIYLRALQIIHQMVDDPQSEILFQCQTNTGKPSSRAAAHRHSTQS